MCCAAGLGGADGDGDVVAPAFVAVPPPVAAVAPGVAAAAYGDCAGGVAIVLAISSPTPRAAPASSVISGVLCRISGYCKSQRQQVQPPARRNDNPGAHYVSKPAARIAISLPFLP